MSRNTSPSPTMFRSADIRGKVGAELNRATAYQIGQAFGSYVRTQGGQSVYMGHDNRPSSPDLADAFAEGMAATGCHVFELGMVPTPLVYFASVRDAGAFAAVVTASHLPATSNGFKFCRGSQAIYGDAIQHLYELITANKLAAGNGSRSSRRCVVDEYVEHILKTIRVQPMNVAVDCQNGAASELAPVLLGRLGLDVYPVHCDLKAPYPFERPDPQEAANLQPLQALVTQVKATVGIVYDGDADRLGLVDERGQRVPADYVVALLARDVLAEYPGAKVVVDILCSQIVADEVSRAGGELLVWKSGHSFIKEKLHETGAALAGEGSGHIFFADRYFGYDDGIYASCRVLELLSRHNDKTLSELVETLPHLFAYPEERPHCPDDKKFNIVQDVKVVFAHSGYPLATVDGVRIQFPNGWGLLRASNTEAALSLRFEATTKDELERYHRIVWEKLIEIGFQYGLDFAKG